MTGVHWLGLEEDIVRPGAELWDVFQHRGAEHGLPQNASPAYVARIRLPSDVFRLLAFQLRSTAEQMPPAAPANLK